MNSNGRRRTQTGMVLLLCLIFLTALTLLGLSAAADTLLQNKLAANLQETERAKQSARAALSWAEHWLLALDGAAPGHCIEACDGLIMHRPDSLPLHPEFESLTWWAEHGHEAGTDPQTGEQTSKTAQGSADKPLWIIEAAHSIPPAENGTTKLQVWYRILARGSGRTGAGAGAAVAVVESTVVRYWPSIESPELAATDTAHACAATDQITQCGRVSWRELR